MILLRFAILFFTMICANFLEASKESAEAYGGDHLGVIWLADEDQNIWRMPQQINKIQNNIQITRSSTSIGGAEGGFFVRNARLKKFLGVSRTINLGLYFNQSNPDFQRVNDNGTVGAHQVSATTGSRVDFFLGGFDQDYNLALRLGFNYLRPAANSSSSDRKHLVTVADIALGATIDGFDLWGKYADEPRSDNGTMNSNSHSYAYQLGLRKEISGFMLYAEYNNGLENHLSGLVLAKRSHANRSHISTSWNLGLARRYAVKKNSNFFWDAQWTYTDLSSQLANFNSSGYNVAKVKGWRFQGLFGFALQALSWLKIVGSFQETLYHDFNKPFDGDKNMAKAALGFSLLYDRFKLDLNSSYANGTTNSLNELLSSTTGTITYQF